MSTLAIKSHTLKLRGAYVAEMLQSNPALQNVSACDEGE